MDIKVNETPVRTSRNFRINNIKLENVDVPEKLNEFKNVNIQSTKAEITDNTKEVTFTYGNGAVITENLKNANSKICINTNKNNEEIKIEYTLDNNNSDLINVIEINAQKSANITIVYKSNTEKVCFKNGAIVLNAKEDAKVNIVVVNMLNNKSLSFDSIENTLEANSKVKYTIIDLGGKYSISNYYSNIIGEGATNDLKTVYLGKNEQVKDINYIAELRGEKTNIDIDAQGVLMDKAKKNFKGTIDFKKGCKKATGDENEFCMLLSPEAKSLALPMLLCTESDVEGNHSTASGKVDNKSLFYIMSRGFSEKEAIKLIVRARFNKIIERIKDEETKELVLNEIDQRLD